MHAIKSLLSLLIDNAFPLFKKGRSFKSVLLTLLKDLVIMALVFAVIWFLSSKIFYFLAIKINGQFFAIAFLATQLISLVFATSHIITKMYMSNENNLLLSFPVSFDELFISKIIMTYISEFIFNILYIFPIFLVFGVVGKLSFTYFIGVVLLLPFMPILPIAFGSLISIPIMFIVKFFKSKPVVTIVVSLIAIAGIFFVYMLIVSKVSGAFNIADQQIDTSLHVNEGITKIGSKIFIFSYVGKNLFAWIDGGTFVKFLAYLGMLLLYTIGSIILVLPCLLLIRAFFQKMTSMNGQISIARKRKVSRVNEIFSKDDVLCCETLCFNEDVIKSTNASKRASLIKKYVKQVAKSYAAKAIDVESTKFALVYALTDKKETWEYGSQTTEVINKDNRQVYRDTVSVVSNKSVNTPLISSIRVSAPKYHKRGQTAELLVNEFKSILRSPSLIFQYFLITVLMPIIVYTYDFILRDIEVSMTGNMIKYAAHFFVLIVLTCLSSMVSSVAISRQGGLFYMTKTFPVDHKKHIFVKTAFNTIITSTMLIITAVVCYITKIVPAYVTTYSTITALFICVGHICHSIDLDLRRPSLSWYDASDISDISKNTAISVLIGVVIGAIVFALIYFLFDENVKVPLNVVLIVSAVYCVTRVYFLFLRAKHTIERMEL